MIFKWKEYCKACNKKNFVELKPCPTCGIHYTPQPVSEKVYEKCKSDYRCDGCHAYAEHLK